MRVLALVVLTATGLLFAGCGSDEPDSTGSAGLAERVGIYQATGTGGDGALLQGTVRLVGNCFTVEQEGVQTRFLPFFPDDEVEWRDGRLDYDGNTYGDGDPIALGGGASGIVEGAAIPENCDKSSGLTPWTVAQQG